MEVEHWFGLTWSVLLVSIAGLTACSNDTEILMARVTEQVDNERRAVPVLIPGVRLDAPAPEAVRLATLSPTLKSGAPEVSCFRIFDGFYTCRWSASAVGVQGTVETCTNPPGEVLWWWWWWTRPDAADGSASDDERKATQGVLENLLSAFRTGDSHAVAPVPSAGSSNLASYRITDIRGGSLRVGMEPYTRVLVRGTQIAEVPGYRAYVEPYDVPPEGLCARAIDRPDRTGDTPPSR
jgi:hypothetical protein